MDNEGQVAMGRAMSESGQDDRIRNLERQMNDATGSINNLRHASKSMLSKIMELEGELTVLRGTLTPRIERLEAKSNATDAGEPKTETDTTSPSETSCAPAASALLREMADLMEMKVSSKTADELRRVANLFEGRLDKLWSERS